MNTNWSAKDLFAAAVLVATLIGNPATAASAGPSTYGVDYVSVVASGRAMNGQGVIAGVRYTLPPGCTPSTCAGVPQAVVWSGNTVIPLPLLPGFSAVTAVGINASNWVVGYAGDPYSIARTVLWKPAGTSYAVMDLGVLPGSNSSWPVGIDNLGRVVGWSIIAPFVWTETGGMVNLATQGFPNDMPLAISPGGTVATRSFWYMLGNAGSAQPMAPSPPGFAGSLGPSAAINDTGDQVRFLATTTSQPVFYLFRYNHAGTWQLLWGQPAGRLAPYGIGGINAAGDITASVSYVGIIAYGPAGVGEPLSARLSPAYGGGASSSTMTVSAGGPINDSGVILAQVMIGRSPRLVRMAAVEPCTAGCIREASIQMAGKMVGFPRGQCTPRAYNIVTATLTVTDQFGSALSGAAVAARFFDDYYLDKAVEGITASNGTVKFTHKGPACVGAIAILVDNITKTGSVLDRTTGELADYVIPQP